MDNNNNNKYLEIKVTDDSYQGQKREILARNKIFFFLIFYCKFFYGKIGIYIITL